ncbi:hypothetical protein HDU98_002985 [Podochytrium sp. JEL0797]|nr:hypothetical protein HDU98_002985 [Podochytrium sp. JEL0797]
MDPDVQAAINAFDDFESADDEEDEDLRAESSDPSPLNEAHLRSLADHCLTLIARARRAAVQHTTDRDSLIQAKDQLRLMLRYVHTNAAGMADLALSLIPALQEEMDALSNCISNVDDEIKKAYGGRIRVDFVHTGGRGRPKKVVDLGQVLEMRKLGVTWTFIALLADMDRSTISKQMRAAGCVDPYNWTDISDNDLLIQVKDIIARFPTYGAGFVMSQLQIEFKTRVSRNRVRHMMHVADPAGVMNRLVKTVVRRKYNVAGPHSLQHIDGNHKLIQEKIVIHVGVDGFSHLITYIKAANNNRPETVLDAFLEGVEKFGLPSRVRCDKGGENILVAEYMIRERGSGRGSIIAGRSVHNQRVERLNLDIRQHILVIFKSIFDDLRARNLFHDAHAWELWVLHQVFIPRLQRHLDHYQETYNNHKKRLCRGLTPNQLFAVGNVMRCQRPQSDDSLIETDGIETFGNDPGGRPRSERPQTRTQTLDGTNFAPRSRTARARVNRIPCPLTENQLLEFQEQWGPYFLVDDGEDGRKVYCLCRDYVRERMVVDDVESEDSDDE